jgi:ribosome-interacting GTPase 1
MQPDDVYPSLKYDRSMLYPSKNWICCESRVWKIRIAFLQRTRYKIPNSVPISSKEWLNVDELVQMMWETLDLVRVYTKPRGLPPDYDAPVVLRRGKCTIEDFCNAIHKEITKQMK